ncbi:MAG: hypothetical protein K8R69_07705 [Deltaproteobacteria bacterium]|nr:hypothetical protein [Deltaproteobacteria bacterium]
MADNREKILRELGPLRWLRAAAMFALLFPILLTALLVLAHKLTRNGMSFLVSGAPWTHWFWSGLFYLMVAGVFLSLLNLARQCPRCGNGFFKRQRLKPEDGLSQMERPGIGFNINGFSRKCLSCGLRIDGSNLDAS